MKNVFHIYTKGGKTMESTYSPSLKHRPLPALAAFLIAALLALTGCAQADGGAAAATAYTVRFNSGDGGGIAPEPISVPSGRSISLPGQGHMTHPGGKLLASWDDGRQARRPGELYPVNENVTLTAQWAEPVTVTFLAGEGNGIVPAPVKALPASVIPGSAIILPGREGMVPPAGKEYFTGWEAGGRIYYSGTSYPVGAGGALTARWAASLADISNLAGYLAGAAGGAAFNDPLPLPVNIDLGTMLSDGLWQQLLAALQTAGKFVALDLSVCTMTGTEFDPGSAAAGKAVIVSLILPDAALAIRDGSDFAYFTTLGTISGAKVNEIGPYAFQDCVSLQRADFPSVKSIGQGAFSGCASLVSVNIPNVITLSANPPQNDPPAYGNIFAGCVSLKNIIVASGNPNFSVVGAMLMNKDEDILIAYPSAAGDITLNGIKTIGQGAFMKCANLTSVESATTAVIEKDAFIGCIRLEWLYFPAIPAPSLPPPVTSIGERAFAGTGSSAALTITLGAAPSVGPGLFESAGAKRVIFRVPYAGQAAWAAAGYDNAWETRLKSGNSALSLSIVSSLSGSNRQ
jgi:hypothetical protein